MIKSSYRILHSNYAERPTMDPKDLDYFSFLHALQSDLTVIEFLAFDKPFSCPPSSLLERMTRNKFPFSRPIVPIHVHTDLIGTAKFVFNILMVPFLFESGILFITSPGELCQAVRLSLALRMIHSVLSPTASPAPPSLPSPKVGLQKPKVLFIDCEKASPRAIRFLNSGLSFVPAHSCNNRSCVSDTLKLANTLALKGTYIPSSPDTIDSLSNKWTSLANRRPLAKGCNKGTLKEIVSLSLSRTIKPSDKGDRIVVMSKSFYQSRVLLLLESSDYVSVKDPKTALIDLSASVSKHILKYLMIIVEHRLPFDRLKQQLIKVYDQDSPFRIGLFYGLPKVHKNSSDPP